MTIFTARELIATVQRRIDAGEYTPDQKLLVTVWVAADVRSLPHDLAPDDPRRMTEADWVAFPNRLSGWKLGELENAQSRLLDEWLDEAAPAAPPAFKVIMSPEG
jgi:hypothetical protein